MRVHEVPLVALRPKCGRDGMDAGMGMGWVVLIGKALVYQSGLTVPAPPMWSVDESADDIARTFYPTVSA
ncbi:hypothetical protein, partial [Nonomuraea basaltis]|uniref:hypothetical protein n=1 Tax=Nonomuraea basaltis TaxID=2495887 RepID=UPI0019800B40